MSVTGRNFACAPRTIGIAAVSACLGWAALGPAAAEDTGLWEAIRSAAPGFRAVAPAPSFSVVVAYAPQTPPPNPEIVRLTTSPSTPSGPSTPQAKLEWQDQSKRENPLARVLRDPTLRPGDVVVFPNGPRVFKGEPGVRHAVHDFVPVSASRDIPQASRKTLLAMPVAENSAWSSATSAAKVKDKVAGLPRDVETTGSIGPGKTVTVYTGRGDVRVVRVQD